MPPYREPIADTIEAISVNNMLAPSTNNGTSTTTVTPPFVLRIWSVVQESIAKDLGNMDEAGRTLQTRLARRDVPVRYVELIQEYSPGYIILSYVIAVVGSLCTLELLLRRTSNRGTYNVLLLVAAGICFGSVSTFSMHFIGNNSLVLHHPLEKERGYPSLTLAYAAGWTVLSLVVSCTCMIGAFFVMGLEVGWERWVGRFFGGRKRRGNGNVGLGAGEVGVGLEVRQRRMSTNTTSELGHGGVNEAADGNEIELEITDLSDHALRDRPGEILALDKDAVVKKKKSISEDYRKHELKLKLDAVIDKLEWALGWSMIDLGSRGGRAERRKRKWEETKAEDKNERADEEGRQNQEEDQEWDHKGLQKEDLAPVHVRPPPSDPVASGYDNEVLEDDIVPASINRMDRSPFDTGRSSREPPRKLSGREAEEGIIPVPVSASNRYARRGSVPNIKLRDRAPYSPLSADSTAPLFSPTFTFPGPGSTLASERTTPLTGSTSTSLYPPPSILQGRRASVPVNSLFPREASTPTYTLARIQSYTEPDGEDPLAGRTVDLSDDEKQAAAGLSNKEAGVSGMNHSEKRRESVASVSFRMDALGDTSTTNLNRSSGAVERNEMTRALSALSEDGHSRPSSRRRPSKTRSDKSGTWLNKFKHLMGYDVVTRQEVRKILVAGTICGWGIAGMHYLGQKSIVSIPYTSYTIGNVVGSVVVACAAVIVALYIMFIVLRPKLKHGWFIKVAIACILGAAVCCMHYIAMGGTTYALIQGVIPPKSAFGATKKMITGIVATLAIIACLSIFTFSVIAHLRNVAHRKGRRRVVIAAMIYDEEDRLLVSPDGMLPMCDIASIDVDSKRRSMHRHKGNKGWDAESSSSSVLDIDLTISHPAFLAALRSTWAWRQPGVVPARRPSVSLPSDASNGSASYQDSMNQADRSTLDASKNGRRISTLSLADSAVYPGTLDGRAPMTLNVGKFVERFSVAVGQLASVITGNEQGVRRLGVLYDRILTTGHVSIGGDRTQGTTVSKGQLIFLVRRVTTGHEKSQLLARNFLFAEPYAVASVMSRTLAVPVENFLDVIDDQRDFCDKGMSQDIRPGRLYASACIIQPTTFEGIRVCVDPQRRHELPHEEICPLSAVPTAIRTQDTNQSDAMITGTIEEIGDALTCLEGQSLFEMLAPRNELLLAADSLPEDPSVVRLRKILVETVIPMLDGILSAKAMTEVLPRLKLLPSVIPLTPPLISPIFKAHGLSRAPEVTMATSMAWTIMFKAVLPVDADHSGLEWESWALFRAQQECILRDGRQGQAAARNALAHATAGSSVHNPARRPSKIQWSTSFTGEDTFGSAGARRSYVDPDTSLGLDERPPIYDSSAQGRTNPNLSITVHRRSSMAPSSTDGPLTFDENDQQQEVAPGVGTWHADWLTRILRQDLHQRPSEYDSERY